MKTTARRALPLVLGASALLSGCIVLPVGPHHPRGGIVISGGGSVRSGGAEVDVIPSAPPAPQVEVVVNPPGPGYFWIAGYWQWLAGRHVWVGGRWEAHRPGYVWTPHQWHKHGSGWRQNGGRWDRR